MIVSSQRMSLKTPFVSETMTKKMGEMEEKIQKHLAFLQRKKGSSLLFGCIDGWENLSRYSSDTTAFFPSGVVDIKDITCERFKEMYCSYAATPGNPDALLRTLEPLPFFPWVEAAMGCTIQYTGMNFWSRPMVDHFTLQELEEYADAIQCGDKWPNHVCLNMTRHSVLATYETCIDYLHERFSPSHPIGQTILRGPLDVAAAVLGDENLIYQFFERPVLVKKILAVAADLFLSFIAAQKRRMPAYANGYVIGTYYIWTPGTNIRLQEDAMSLLSPELYREFVYPLDCRIAAAADYTLFHLHASALHLLEILLETKNIRIFQISKDEGIELQSILAKLQMIQKAGNCLLLKGRFTLREAQLAVENLHPEGLCIQAVVLDDHEKDEIYTYFNQIESRRMT